MSRLPNIGLEALEAESKPGHCLACDAPLPPLQYRPDGRPLGRRRVVCDDSECRRVYATAYGVGRRTYSGAAEAQVLRYLESRPSVQRLVQRLLGERRQTRGGGR